MRRSDGTCEFLTKEQFEVKYGKMPDGNGPYMAEAEPLRSARIEMGVGLRELAKELGVPPSWLCGIEHGREKITPAFKQEYENALTAIGLRERP